MTVSHEDMLTAARALLDLCKRKKLTIATAESCTGGLVAAALTEIAGSSAVVDRGYVTYTNDAKQEMLGVSPLTLETHGAVSAQCAREMALGALAQARSSLSVSITGIAGPTGAVPGKPIGLVFFAAASRGGRVIGREQRFGDIGRTEVRRRSVLEAFAMLTELADKEEPHPPAEGD